MTQTVAFFSYARQDEENTRGLISKIHAELQKMVQLKTGDRVIVFRDEDRIDLGDDWQEQLQVHLAQANILVPILTPTYFSRPWCRRELEHFLDRRRLNDGSPSILPVRLVDMQPNAAEERRLNDRLVNEISNSQQANWVKYAKIRSARLPQGFVNAIDRLAERIADILDRLMFDGAGESIRFDPDEERGALLIDPGKGQDTSDKNQSSKNFLERTRPTRVLSPEDRRKVFVHRLESLLSESADVVNAFNNHLSTSFSFDQSGTSGLATELLDLRVEEATDCLRETHTMLKREANKSAATILCRITRLVLPAIFNPDLLRSIESCRHNMKASLIPLNAATRTVSEVVMAGVDGREAGYRKTSDDLDWPGGELELPITPEGGLQSFGEQFEASFHQHLENQFTNQEDRIRFARDVLQRQVAIRLRVSADRGQTYYYVFSLADEEFANPKLEAAVDRLKAAYPSIVFIRLSNDPEIFLDEIELFEPLRDHLGPSVSSNGS